MTLTEKFELRTIKPGNKMTLELSNRLIVQKDVGFYRKAKSIKPEDEARHDRR
jgi:hypothetical protein